MPLLQDASFVISFGWILHRIWQIYQKSTEELVDLLGLDIPLAPEVSLAGITTDSALLYWKPPENPVATLKYVIQVNGIKIGEFGRGDASVQIIGLKPSHYYNVQVIATNASHFSSLGSLIRIRTTPLSSTNTGVTTISEDENSEFLTNDDEPASIRASSTHFDPTVSVIAPSINRELSGNYHNKRTISARRSSPSKSGNEIQTSHANQVGSADEDEVNDSLQGLSEKLELSRQEQQGIDRQIYEEESDAKKNIAELGAERDCLRHCLREKEEASSELRRHGNHLDKLNRMAQSKKAAKEKILLQKRSERQKMKDEINSWNQETIDLGRTVDKMFAEKTNLISMHEVELTDVQRRNTSDQSSIKSLEEDIHTKGIQIKEIEERRGKLGPFSPQQDESTKENEKLWDAKSQAAQAQLATLWQTLQLAQAENRRAQKHLAWWTSKRASDPAHFTSLPIHDFVSPINANRSRRRQPNSRTSTLSTPSDGYSPANIAFNNPSGVSPTFTSTSPFLNLSNTTTLPLSSDKPGLGRNGFDASTDEDRMSPAAKDLLPSNLFRDEDVSTQQALVVTSHEPHQNESSDIFGTQGSALVDAGVYGPHTPVSASSQAGSLFSSPHDSLQNLHSYQSCTDSYVDNEKQPINSTAEANPLVASRIANLLSTTFNRQRGKSATQDSPSLGTLKQGQSHSFPRNLETPASDPFGSRRRRGSHGTWANPVVGLLNRNAANTGSLPDGNGVITARTGSGRRSRLNMFGPKFENVDTSIPTDKALSSRPSSMYSYDLELSRPSNESQRLGWSVADAIPSRSSPLGTNWSMVGGPWTSGLSRRKSVHHTSTSNLSIGSTPLESDSNQDPMAKLVPDQLPIGTRPSSSQQNVIPKLNPTAPSFKTLFSRGESKRATKSDKSVDKYTEKVKDDEIEGLNVEDTDHQDDLSPTKPRLSKDSQSISTAASMADSYDSLDRSVSGISSEAVTPSATKETLMQKITRKSSSSKFNVPWGKERSILFTKRAGDPVASDENNDDTLNDVPPNKSVDTVSNSLQQEKIGRTNIWPNMRRKSKKNTPTANEELEKHEDPDEIDEGQLSSGIVYSD